MSSDGVSRKRQSELQAVAALLKDLQLEPDSPPEVRDDETWDVTVRVSGQEFRVQVTEYHQRDPETDGPGGAPKLRSVSAQFAELKAAFEQQPAPDGLAGLAIELVLEKPVRWMPRRRDHATFIGEVWALAAATWLPALEGRFLSLYRESYYERPDRKLRLFCNQDWDGRRTTIGLKLLEKARVTSLWIRDWRRRLGLPHVLEWNGEGGSIGFTEPELLHILESKVSKSPPTARGVETWLLVTAGGGYPQMMGFATQAAKLREWATANDLLSRSTYDRAYVHQPGYGPLLGWTRPEGWVDLPLASRA